MNQRAGMTFKPNRNPIRLGRERWKDPERSRGEGKRMVTTMLASLLACPCLLNQTSWLVLPSPCTLPPAPETLYSVSFLFVWLKTWPFLTPRRRIEEEQEGKRRKREGQRGGWRVRRQGERHWTLQSWDWFTSLTEITSLTYKPEVKISH